MVAPGIGGPKSPKIVWRVYRLRKITNKNLIISCILAYVMLNKIYYFTAGSMRLSRYRLPGASFCNAAGSSEQVLSIYLRNFHKNNATFS